MAADRYVDGNAPPGGDGLSWGTAWNTWAPMQAYLNGGAGRSGEGRNLTEPSAVSLTQANTTLTGDGTLIFSNAGGVGISLSNGPFVFDAIVVANCGGIGINGNGTTTLSMTDCDVYGNTGDGVGNLGLILSCVGCNIYNNTGQGLTDYNKAGTRTITDSNFYNNGSHGLNTNPINASSSIAVTSSNFYRNGSAGCVFQTNNMTGTINFTSCQAYQNGNYGFWNIIGNTNVARTFTSCIARFNTSVGFTFSSPTASPNIVLDQCAAIGEIIGLQLVSGYTGSLSILHCDFIFCQTGCNFNQNAAYSVDVIDSIFYFCLLGVIKHATPTVNITYCDFNSNVTDVDTAVKGTGCITGAPDILNVSADPPNLRIKSTSACIGAGSTGDDIGVFQYSPAPSIPSFTAVANADDASINLVLAALPAGADEVNFYARSETGYDIPVGTLTGAGTVIDDNGGSGYPKYKVVHYVAIAEDTGTGDISLPSFDRIGQTGTVNKFKMGAFLEALRDIFKNDPTLITTLGFHVRTKDIPADLADDKTVRNREIVIVPDEENPDVRYATGRVENQLPVRIYVMAKKGSGDKAYKKTDDGVERILELLAINYRWNESVYNTAILPVDRRDTIEGAQGNFAVATIPLISFGQYAKFI